jgi:AraC-like DNA-binding protein
VLEHRDTLVPLAAMASVFQEAARTVGDRSFGLRVGHAMTHLTYGAWLEYSAAGSTLGEGLRRSVESMRFHQTTGQLSLTLERTFAIWRYHPPGRATASIQHSDHVVGPMCRFVASYLGPGWRPAWIDLDYQRDPDWRAIDALTGAPLRFEQPGVGIAIAIEDLACSRLGSPSTRYVTLHDVAERAALQTTDEPVRSILALVSLRLLEGATDIEGTAATVGLDVQGLQRRLRAGGVSYCTIVKMARRRRAEALLRETIMTITQIALALGYADHASFTRAFNRTAGCSPSDYRRRARDEAGRQRNGARIVSGTSHISVRRGTDEDGSARHLPSSPPTSCGLTEMRAGVARTGHLSSEQGSGASNSGKSRAKILQPH